MGRVAKYRKISRIQPAKFCWYCGRDDIYLDHHEFLNGPDKKHAIDDDLWVWICRMCHDRYQNDEGRMNVGRMLSQSIFEAHIGTRDDFRSRYRKSYL